MEAVWKLRRSCHFSRGNRNCTLTCGLGGAGCVGAGGWGAGASSSSSQLSSSSCCCKKPIIPLSVHSKSPLFLYSSCTLFISFELPPFLFIHTHSYCHYLVLIQLTSLEIGGGGPRPPPTGGGGRAEYACGKKLRTQFNTIEFPTRCGVVIIFILWWRCGWHWRCTFCSSSPSTSAPTTCGTSASGSSSRTHRGEATASMAQIPTGQRPRNTYGSTAPPPRAAPRPPRPPRPPRAPGGGAPDPGGAGGRPGPPKYKINVYAWKKETERAAADPSFLEQAVEAEHLLLSSDGLDTREPSSKRLGR